MSDKTLPVRIPEGLIKELDKLVNEEGMFLSRSDALRHGARLVLLLARGTKTFEELKKDWKSV